MQRLGRKVTSLDDLSLRESAQNDPQLFLDLVANPVALDEVQYAPALFAEIKKRVDAVPLNHLAEFVRNAMVSSSSCAR